MREFASWLVSVIYGSSLALIYFIYWLLPDEAKPAIIIAILIWLASTLIMAVVINDNIKRQK